MLFTKKSIFSIKIFLTSPDANFKLFSVQIFDVITDKTVQQICNNTFKHHLERCKLKYRNYLFFQFIYCAVLLFNFLSKKYDFHLSHRQILILTADDRPYNKSVFNHHVFTFLPHIRGIFQSQSTS
jgi:hypothetical protein